MAKIVHISDLHISESLSQTRRFPYVTHRYGHDVRAFLALDAFLKTYEWDLLLITGDISRIGNKESFQLAKNWLHNELNVGNAKIGLNLENQKSKQRYVIVPGNHDRFNGGLRQTSLDNYHQEFPPTCAGTVEKFNINGITINIHKFDSSYKGGSFAYGKVEQRALIPKDLQEDEIDLAVLHHHFLQPPDHDRELTTELTNSAEVAAYMLSTGFDGVFFGHTHKSYIDRPNVGILNNQLNDRRKRPRFWSRHVPRFLTRIIDNDGLVSYRRERAMNDQLPKMEVYFSYLHLRELGVPLRGPSAFKNIHAFYEQMNNVVADANIADEIAKIQNKKILISLAPSACQIEAKWNGLHVIKIDKGPKSQFTFEWERYQYDRGQFRPVP